MLCASPRDRVGLRAACIGLVLLWGVPALPAQVAATAGAPPIGSWGGDGIRLDVTQSGAKVEYDCAVGTIDEAIRPDAEGHFEARGTHVFERGGPRHPGESPPTPHKAVYRGRTDGKSMQLAVRVADGGREVGRFSLSLGRPARLNKCS